MSKKSQKHKPIRHSTQPRDLDRWLERSTKQAMAGDYAGALTTLRRVAESPLASRQQRSSAYDHMGALYTQLQRFDDAYAMSTLALELSPDNPALWFNRGMASRFTARLAQSLSDLERAAELDTGGLLTKHLAKVLPDARAFAESERALRSQNFTLDQLLAQEVLFHQATQVMGEGRWAEAADLFRQSIALGDVLPQPQTNLGLCLLMQRQFDEAEAAFRRALEIDPDYPVARQNLAGLPEIRASGKLPAVRIKKAFEGTPLKAGISFVPAPERR
jgi:Flp pilus assembly protein TadD